MRRNRRRYVKLGVLGAALAVLMAVSLACGAEETATPAPTAAPVPTTAPVPTAAPAGQPVYGGIVRHAVSLECFSLDPPYGLGGSCAMINYLMYDKIVGLDPEMNLVPQIAESWEISADGKAIVLHIRRGVKFHDGTQVDAQAIKWSLDRCLDPDVVCGFRLKIELIDRVTVEDDYTVTMHLRKPWRPLLAALAAEGGNLPSPTAVLKFNSYSNRNGEYGRNPVGAGPFRFVEWIPDNRLVVERNADYWDKGKPYLDGVVLQNVPEASSVLAMIRTGDTDIMESPRAADLELVRGNVDLKIDEYESGRTYQIIMNLAKPPFDNRSLRQAVAYAIDRQTVIDVQYGGKGRIASSIIGVGWAYDPNIRQFEYNPQKAREKLIEAGHPDGVTFPFLCRTRAADIQLCEVLQAQLTEVGLRAEIDQVPPSDYSPRRREGDFNISATYRTPLGDPHLLIAELFQEGGPGNYMNYRNPEVDRLLEQGGGVFDTAKARPIYSEVQRIIGEDAPSVYYMWSTEFTILNRKVANFQRTPDLDLNLRELWLEK